MSDRDDVRPGSLADESREPDPLGPPPPLVLALARARELIATDAAVTIGPWGYERGRVYAYDPMRTIVAETMRGDRYHGLDERRQPDIDGHFLAIVRTDGLRIARALLRLRDLCVHTLEPDFNFKAHLLRGCPICPELACSLGVEIRR